VCTAGPLQMRSPACCHCCLLLFLLLLLYSICFRDC
jgi:hypothetical protein